jgi:hypothetical protein
VQCDPLFWGVHAHAGPSNTSDFLEQRSLQRYLPCAERDQKTVKGSWVAFPSLLSPIDQKANSVVVILSLKQIPFCIVSSMLHLGRPRSNLGFLDLVPVSPNFGSMGKGYGMLLEPHASSPPINTAPRSHNLHVSFHT